MMASPTLPTPVQAGSPWPTFRHDERNTGHSPIVARYHGDRPWSFRTGKGIFSTPVIDAQGIVYVGSGDHIFYALTPEGQEKWRCETGEIIDSAGALPRADPPAVVFPSGDGLLRCLRTDDGSLVWSLDARVSPRASYNNWFEGNVAIGHDGTLYAGNTNFNYYAVRPDGALKWTYPTGANNWSIAAIAGDGTLFWGSNDTKIRAVRPDGSEKWSRRTLGFIAASAALGSDGALYVGSFDSCLYALDSRTGRVKWKFKTNDHIYASAALGADAAGNTDAVYVGSTDGSLYALTPDGKLRWSYDTGDPIRSSPVLGRAPEGETGDILYFGCGNGRLYALNTRDGARRWSFDTTPGDTELRDRNDLNGSPALGATGVYIGGEHGELWYVPYDYALHVRDERASTQPGEDLPPDLIRLFYVTPGGSTQPAPAEALPAATHLTLRLMVRERGKTVDARVWNAPMGRPRDALDVRARPAFPFRVEPSADGRYIHINPAGLLEPDTEYTLDISGLMVTGGWHIGNLTLGGRPRGRFHQEFTFRTARPSSALLLAHQYADEAPALEWSRLAVPIPTMLPSLNQLGFDYMDWILGTIACAAPDENQPGRLILWAIGGRTERGQLRVDPGSDFCLPLSGVYRDDVLSLTNRRFTMQVTGIPIPFNEFQLRGQLGPDGRVRPGATSYAETQVLAIPTFGPYLVMAGLANNWWHKLVAKGTFITRLYHGPANRRPAGIGVASLDYATPTRTRAGQITAQFKVEPGAAYPRREHRPAIVLIDEDKLEAVSLDYHRQLAGASDAQGNLASVTLTIPAGTRLPSRLKAIVILDVFPVHEDHVKEER